MNIQSKSITALLSCFLIIANVNNSSSQDVTPLNDYWRHLKESKDANAAKIMKFTEFLEARLDVTIPDWWQARLQLSSNGLGSGGPLTQNNDIDTRTKRSRRSFAIEQDGEDAKLKFEADGLLVDLDASIADEEKIPATSVDCLRLGDGSVVVARLRGDGHLIVARIENRSEIVWYQKTTVPNPNNRSAGYTGVALDACVEIIRKKNSIIIMGAKLGVSCMFVFELDQGDELDAGIFDQLR